MVWDEERGKSHIPRETFSELKSDKSIKRLDDNFKSDGLYL